MSDDIRFRPPEDPDEMPDKDFPESPDTPEEDIRLYRENSAPPYGEEDAHPPTGETIRFRRDGTAPEPCGDQPTIIIPGKSSLPDGGKQPGKLKGLLAKIPRRALLIGGASLFTVLLLVVAVILMSGGGTETPYGTETPDSTNNPTPVPTASPSPSPTPEATPEPSPTPEITFAPVNESDINPLTGVLLADNSVYGKRPIAVMHNNIKAALPMHGISQADILYEMLAEGNITRLVGIYQDYAPIVSLGAVRSTRTYYLELALNHDAMLVHAGASYIAYDDIKRWGMTTVDGIKGTFGKYFWRDQARLNAGVSSEHTLFTSGANIKEAIEGLRMQDHKSDFKETLQFTYDGTPEEGTAAVKINVQFLSTKTTGFQYDAERAVYTVMEFGEAMMDGSTDTQVAVTNVLILEADIGFVPGDSEGRRTADLSSGGKGYFACGGSYIPILWSRGNYDGQFSYTTVDGEPLLLGAGKSYICIIPDSAPEPAFLKS